MKEDKKRVESRRLIEALFKLEATYLSNSSSIFSRPKVTQDAMTLEHDAGPGNISAGLN